MSPTSFSPYSAVGRARLPLMQCRARWTRSSELCRRASRCICTSPPPLPHDVDTTQLEGLRAFRDEISQRGLLGEFSNVSQLQHEVWKAIEYDIAKLSLGVPVIEKPVSGVRFQVQPKQEREIRDYGNKGKPRYRTRHWIEITNAGDKDAADVVFEPVGDNPSMFLVTDGTPTVIHAGQTRSLNVEHSFGGGDPDVLRLRWTEDGQAKEREFHV